MKIIAKKSSRKLTPAEREVIALRRAMILTRENYARVLASLSLVSIDAKMTRQNNEWQRMGH